MSAKEKLLGLKKLLFGETVKFTEHSLADGSKINIEKLEVGGKVEFAKADGNNTPAPAGVFELHDKTKFTVGADGTITAVTAPDVPLVPKEYVLTDASKVLIDKLEIGGKVTKPNPDGTTVAVPAGTLTLADGMVLTVDETGTITVVTPKDPIIIDDTLPEDMKTPEQMIDAIKKFADPTTAGTSPDVQKMAVILKAVVENVVGWQLREAQDKATRDAAIAAYQTGFNAAVKENGELKAELVKVKQGFKELIDIVEEGVEDAGEESLEKKETFKSIEKKERGSRFDRLVKSMDAVTV